jgi:hypothetical protein
LRGDGEQQVFGAQVVMAQVARLILGDDDDPPCAIGEACERTRR